MFLSIGMIVKNEEENLRKCMEGLLPLRERLKDNAELIITDTGSTDGTVKIAEEYADKVIHFEWCSDFAAARNTTVEASTGEWYMFLDADEFFTEVDGIAEFFLSGEYRKYNSGTYIVNNLAGADGKRSSYFNAPRLVKMTEQTKFEGAVHESLSPYKEPVKFLEHAIADHVGYMYDDDKNAAKRKFDRNLPLLLKEVERKPDNSMLYLQLAEAHAAVGEFEKELEYIDKGIEVSERNNDLTMCGLYLRKAEYYIQKEQSEKAVETIDEYLAIPRRDTGIDLEFYGQKAHHLFLLKRYREAIETYSKYAQFYKEYQSGKHRTLDTMIASANFSRPDVYADSMFNAVIACVNADRLNTARAFLNTIPHRLFPDDLQRMNRRIKQELVVMRGMKNFSGAAKFYATLTPTTKAMFLTSLTDHIAHSTDGIWILEGLMKQKFPEGVLLALGVYKQMRTQGVPADEMREYMKQMKERTQETPEIAPLVKFVIEEHKDFQQASRSEFEYLAAQAKKNIRMLIAGGETAGAQRLLAEYERLCPKDEDIPEMKKDLGIGK